MVLLADDDAVAALAVIDAAAGIAAPVDNPFLQRGSRRCTACASPPSASSRAIVELESAETGCSSAGRTAGPTPPREFAASAAASPVGPGHASGARAWRR